MAVVYFKRKFIEAGERRQQDRVPDLRRLWRDRRELNDLVDLETPQFKTFSTELEIHGDVLASLALVPALKDSGALRIEERFASPEMFLSRKPIWTVSWRGSGVATVDRRRRSPVLAEQWNRIYLTMQLKAPSEPKSGWRIDTEFFAPNEAYGLDHSSDSNELEDLEKYHVVWKQVEAGSDDFRVHYVGLGTNEPYDDEHGDVESTDIGRPRYFIFDRDRNLSLRYQVDWADGGAFDWDWSHRPVTTVGGKRQVAFVDMPGGTRWCVSDREVARAAAGVDREHTLKVLKELLNVEFSESEAVAAFRRWTAAVQGPQKSVISTRDPEPDITQVLLDVVPWDYTAYFVAVTVPPKPFVSANALLQKAKKLGEEREEQYRVLMETRCADAFVSKWARLLPDRMGQLFGMSLTKLPKGLAEVVDRWRKHISGEVERDRYHFGQAPFERINRLRLGALLALQQEGPYWKALSAAKEAIARRERRT